MEDTSNNLDTNQEQEDVTQWRVDWTAYIGTFFSALLFVIPVGLLCLFVWFVLSVVSVSFSIDTDSMMRGFLIFITTVFVLKFIHSCLYQRSLILFYDDDGIWVYSGVFPWTKGTRGIQWEHVGQATFQLGLLSWIFKSYDITVTNKFKENANLTVEGVGSGNEAVTIFNSIAMHIQSSANKQLNS